VPRRIKGNGFTGSVERTNQHIAREESFEKCSSPRQVNLINVSEEIAGFPNFKKEEIR